MELVTQRLDSIPRRTLLPAVAALAAGIAGSVWLWQFRDASPAPPPEVPSLPVPIRQPAFAEPAELRWRWPDGVPGFRPYAVDVVSGTIVDPVTLRPDPQGRALNTAQVSQLETVALGSTASELGLNGLRIVAAERAPVISTGTYALFGVGAARDASGATCLATWTPARTGWHCPGDRLLEQPALAIAHVTSSETADGAERTHLVLAGVARGDVHRIELLTPDRAPQTVYERGPTWGEISGAYGLGSSDWHLSRLELYGSGGGLIATMPIDVATETATVLRADR